jgi:hypothetical protein
VTHFPHIDPMAWNGFVPQFPQATSAEYRIKSRFVDGRRKRLHKNLSPACEAAALDCFKRRYPGVFFVDSKNRKSKNRIVL